MPDGGIGLDFTLLQQQAQRKGLALGYQSGYYELTCASGVVGRWLSLARVEHALDLYEPDDYDELNGFLSYVD